LRIALVSDIHANLHALEAVFAALEDEQHDAVWNLGDTIGYGPRPNECCAAAQSTADLSLVGNHDLVVLGKGDVDVSDFNPEAAAAARWTRETLTEESREFLDALSPSAEQPGVELYHASPRDPVWEYILTIEAALAAFRATKANLVLVGHSHVPIALQLDGDDVGGGLARAGTDVDLSGGRWLLNPGSVGQPRDGDARAAYCLLDLDAGSAGFRRVPYDIEATQTEMRDQGLPEGLATRLSHGA
jgi:diadenosine tetraphosphatase ApaH/serine/threonine PP2A family protein phosphatase